MQAWQVVKVLLSGIVPVFLYLPLLTGSIQLQRRTPGLAAAAEPVWLAILIGSTAVGFALVVRQVKGFRLLIALFYFPAVMFALGYLGLVLGIYLGGDGP